VISTPTSRLIVPSIITTPATRSYTPSFITPRPTTRSIPRYDSSYCPPPLPKPKTICPPPEPDYCPPEPCCP
jgi:hypothetical protein